MATLNHTTPAYDWIGLTADATERTVSHLQRVSVVQLEQALARKRMTDLERDLMRKAHAMLHGDVEAADHWMAQVVELSGRTLTDRERALLGLVDVLAQTCTA